MKRSISLLGALVALVAGSSALALPSAQAVEPDAAYCPATSVSGHVTYTPGVTVTPGPNTFTMTVSCTTPVTGTSDEEGAYSLTLNGSTLLDTCVSGTGNPSGSGTVTGSGPEGAIAGQFTFTKPGIHYYISGTYTSAGENHRLQLWLDVVNQSPSACFYNAADLIGHGGFIDTDTPPPPPPSGHIAAHVTGSGTISPGLVTTAVFETYTFAGQAVGLFNGEPGTCNAFFNASSTSAESVASGQGGFSGSCSGTTTLGSPINVACSGSYTRAVNSVTLTGSCTGTTNGVLAGSMTMSPTSLNPTTSYTATGDVTVN